MSEKPDMTEFVDDIERWLDAPQSHLNDQSRRKVLELMVSDHVDKIKRTVRARARAKDFLLVAAVLTALGSFGPTILSLFGVSIQ